MEEMKYYEVSKKGSNVKFKFDTYEQALDFCNTLIMIENGGGADQSGLYIREIDCIKK